MMTKTKKTSFVAALAMTAVFALSLGFGMLGGAGRNFAAAQSYASSESVLVYDAAEFKVTEDYAPFVPAAMMSTAGGTTLLDPDGEQTMRLDGDKTGLLIESVQTGEAVEGKSFSFANAMSGEFSMDFRVFSEKSVVSQITQASVKGGNISMREDTWNPYMDIREIGITIRSVSDESKAFTVYVYSGQCYAWNYEAVARVAIEGESFLDDGLPGYGIYEGDAGAGYGYTTPLQGTSFSNANVRNKETYSTTIKFDPTTMCVYGVNKTATTIFEGGIGNIGVDYQEEDVLIRNVGTNRMSADDSGKLIQREGLKTLSAKDFASGYTVEVTIENMTSDTAPLTVLNSLGADEENDGFHNNGKAVVVEGYENGYPRTAKMVIYSVNGQEFVKNDKWTLEQVDNTVVAFDTERGLTQICNPWDDTPLDAEYVTDVKAEGQAGSTRFISGEGSVDFSLCDSYYNYFSANGTVSLPVYLKDNGEANNYTLQIWTKSGTWLGEVALKANEWVTLTFKGQGGWGFCLSDCYFTVHQDWTCEAGDEFYFGKMTISLGNYNIDKAILLTSEAENIAAEGNSFAIDPADFLQNGEYVLGMTALSEKYAPVTSKVDYADLYSKNEVTGTGTNNTYESDPYPDVLELGVKITSETDPTQSFTVYLSSRSTYRNRTTTRVYVEGESYRNGSGQKGIAYTAATNQALVVPELQTGVVSGTMGQWGNTGTNYNAMDELISFIKFDPVNMKVYSYGYGWNLIRDLTSTTYATAGGERSTDKLGTLDASVFTDENGEASFTMEVFVSRMNTEWNKGLDTIYHLADGKTQTAVNTGYTGVDGKYVLSSGYDRKCSVLIASGRLSKDTVPTAEHVTLPENGYEVTYEWTTLDRLADAELSESVTLSAPQVVNLFETKDYEGEVSYSCAENGDSGTIEFVDGVGTFTPAGVGEYVITCGEYSKAIKVGYKINYDDGKGETSAIVIENAITLGDYEPTNPDAAFIGWKVENLNGVYSSDYTLNLEEGNFPYFEAKFIDLEMMAGAGIRLNLNSPGIRFGATIAKESYEDVIALLGEGNYGFSYSMTGNSKTVTKEIEEERIVYDEEIGKYVTYASVVNLSEMQYATNFYAEVNFAYTTADGKELNVYAKETEDPERCVQEVAQKALESGDPYTEEEIAILEEFADLKYAKTLYSESEGTEHVQGICTDKDYLYVCFTSEVVKQDLETGEVVGKLTNLKVNNTSHGGNCVIYNKMLYIAMSIQSVDEYLPRAFVMIVDPTKIVGNVSAVDSDIVSIVYIGKPLLELVQTAGYYADGSRVEEKYSVWGGWLGVKNSIDSITFGPKPGADDDKMYLTFCLGGTSDDVLVDGLLANEVRDDFQYACVFQYDVDDWENKGYYMPYLEVAKLYENGAIATGPFNGPEEFDNIWFFKIGLSWGVQNIVYDSYQNVYIAASYGLQNFESEYDDFWGYVLDVDSLQRQEIPCSGGYEGIVLNFKCGKIGYDGILGYYLGGGGIEWGTGLSSLGNGYYYFNKCLKTSFGNAAAEVTLYRWNINPKNINTADSPFEQVL